MRIQIEIGKPQTEERLAEIRIGVHEIDTVYLHTCSRQGEVCREYMRRHPRLPTEDVDPNRPVVSPCQSRKIPIASHLAEMVEGGVLSPDRYGDRVAGQAYTVEPVMIAVPISDLAANLLRPYCVRTCDGTYEWFYFDEEPICSPGKEYLCACLLETASGCKQFTIKYVRMDPQEGKVLDLASSENLTAERLVWAAALVPLVIDGSPVGPVGIAQANYDLRQILGRSATDRMKYAYRGWYDEWNRRVEEVVREHESTGMPFATFYHSALAVDRFNNVVVRQVESTLPDLAKKLAAEGMAAAGILDSGGSCAIYDPWLGGYLNHGWYFREPRGSILVFRLNSFNRIPCREYSWIHQRRGAALWK